MTRYKRNILITGVTGQDGRLLANCFASEDRVIGSSRREINISETRRLGLMSENISVVKLNLNKSAEIEDLIHKYDITHIYHTSGQSSVAKSFQIPTETEESIVGSCLGILEAIKKYPRVKLFNFVSSECFGNCPVDGANESTNFNPGSPYANAKVSTVHLCEYYQRHMGLDIVNLFLFNHESNLRSEVFVTHKIAKTAFQIKKRLKDRIELGNISMFRDWMWAPELVMFLTKNIDTTMPGRLVLGSGTSITIEDFATKVFEIFDLELSKYLVISKKYQRPHEIEFSLSNPQLACRSFDWNPSITGLKVAQQLCKIYRDKKT